MDLSDPAAAFGPSCDLALLRALAADRTPRSGRRLAADAGVAHSTALRVLDRMAREGVAIELEAGRARLFRLNEEHVLAPAILGIASAREQLLARIRDEIGGWDIRPEAAVVFGSFARGDGDAAADIDLLLMRSARTAARAGWTEQVDRLADRVLAWSGNHLGLVEVTVEELAGEAQLQRAVRDEGLEITDGALRALPATTR